MDRKNSDNNTKETKSHKHKQKYRSRSREQKKKDKQQRNSSSSSSKLKNNNKQKKNNHQKDESLNKVQEQVQKEQKNDDVNKIIEEQQKNPVNQGETNEQEYIQCLQDTFGGILQEKYNEQLQKKQIDQQIKRETNDQTQINKKSEKSNAIENQIQNPIIKQERVITRAGGVYIPPHKLLQIQQQIMEQNKNGEEHQKLMWEYLRKSINGIINKVNIVNIQNVIIELLNENLLRGKGLLARAIIKAQMAAPNFTHVYTALIAVINTKLPEIVHLIIRRVILQFQRSYKRNNKIVCVATMKMLAHLINQKVLSDYVGLQLLYMLLEKPTEDTVELACDFMTECGQVLSEITPTGVNAIFERFKGILHEGEIDRRVQYCIENLFAVRKTKFLEHPGVIPELDLVEEEDQIIHEFDLLDQLDGEELLNIFKLDPFYEKTEQEWEEIKKEILGEENILQLKTMKKVEQDEIENEDQEEDKVQDLTEEDLVNLRRTLYLVIMSSVDFEECAHKLLKMNIGTGHEDEICNMIIDCCMNERTYMRFYGLLAQRFCELSEIFRDSYMKAFVQNYTVIHRYETNKIRNCAKLFAHLFFTDSIDFKVLKCITLTLETTTSSSRIFIKNMILEICENMGLDTLNQKFQSDELKEYLTGLFPIDHPKNTRFAINFFTSIGVGALTVNLRKVFDEQQKQLAQQQLPSLQQQNEEMQVEDDDNDSDSDSDSSNSSNSSSSVSSNQSDDNENSNSESDKKQKQQNKIQQKEKEKKKQELVQEKQKQKNEKQDSDKEKEYQNSKTKNIKEVHKDDQQNSKKKEDNHTKKKTKK